MPQQQATIKQTRSILNKLIPSGTWENLAFFEGDHWQKSKAWIGPRPLTTELNAALAMTEIRRQFQSANVIKEIVKRHSNAVAGRDPRWAIVEGDTALAEQMAAAVEAGDQTRADLLIEINEALTVWWDSDDREIMTTIQDAIDRALLAQRVVLQLFIPPALVSETGEIQTFESFAQAMDQIWLDLLPIGEAGHLRDPATMASESIYVYKISPTDQRMEKQRTVAANTLIDPALATDAERADKRMITLIEKFKDGAAGLELLESVALDTGGRLLTFELRLPQFVTDQIRQLQMGLNVDLTMMLHNILGTGFLERTITNAQMPGETIKDPTAPNGQRFIPKPYRVGQGTTNNLVGVKIKDKEGNTTGYATPSVIYREPGSVDMFTGAQAAIYSTILHEAGQLHALISGDASASGESRKQALQDFITSISLTITRAQSMIRWILETVVALSAYLCDREDEVRTLRAEVAMRITRPPLSAEEMNAITGMIKDEIITHETGLALLPEIDDPTAELARLATQKAEQKAADAATLAEVLREQQRKFDQGNQAPITTPQEDQPDGGTQTSGEGGE